MARGPLLPYTAQTSYREQYRAARPGWMSSGDQFDLVVQKHLTPESAVLDLGCGRTGGIERFWRDARLAVGIDADHGSLVARGQGMRVLKPGGHFVFLTPNALNPLVMGNRVGQLAPWLQKQLVSNVYGRDGADTFAVRYRANTSSRIREMAAATGFDVSGLKVIADPTYVAFNALLFKAAMLSDRMLPAGLGVHLLGDLQKRPSP